MTEEGVAQPPAVEAPMAGETDFEQQQQSEMTSAAERARERRRQEEEAREAEKARAMLKAAEIEAKIQAATAAKQIPAERSITSTILTSQDLPEPQITLVTLPVLRSESWRATSTSSVGKTDHADAPKQIMNRSAGQTWPPLNQPSVKKSEPPLSSTKSAAQSTNADRERAPSNEAILSFRGRKDSLGKPSSADTRVWRKAVEPRKELEPAKTTDLPSVDDPAKVSSPSDINGLLPLYEGRTANKVTPSGTSIAEPISSQDQVSSRKESKAQSRVKSPIDPAKSERTKAKASRKATPVALPASLPPNPEHSKVEHTTTEPQTDIKSVDNGQPVVSLPRSLAPTMTQPSLDLTLLRVKAAIDKGLLAKVGEVKVQPTASPKLATNSERLQLPKKVVVYKQEHPVTMPDRPRSPPPVWKTYPIRFPRKGAIASVASISPAQLAAFVVRRGPEVNPVSWEPRGRHTSLFREYGLFLRPFRSSSSTTVALPKSNAFPTPESYIGAPVRPNVAPTALLQDMLASSALDAFPSESRFANRNAKRGRAIAEQSWRRSTDPKPAQVSALELASTVQDLLLFDDSTPVKGVPHVPAISVILPTPKGKPVRGGMHPEIVMPRPLSDLRDGSEVLSEAFAERAISDHGLANGTSNPLDVSTLLHWDWATKRV